MGFRDIAHLDPDAFARHAREAWERPDLSDAQLADLHYHARIRAL